jgi:hypothetical protein
MRERVIETEAESLEKARTRLESRIPEGFLLLSERVLSDGRPRTVTATADTAAEAFAEALNAVPEGADVVGRRELASPERRVMTVEAFDEESAKSQLRLRAETELGSAAVFEGFKLATAGRKGVLGIGKTPNQYRADVWQPAMVEITYRTKARISARIGAPVREPSPRSPKFATLLTRFDTAQHVEDLLFFLRRGSELAIEQICAYYPLDNILPGLQQRSIRQLHRLERITTLALLLARYQDIRQDQPDQGLPPDLDHRHLSNILMPRLTTFIGRLRRLSTPVLTSIVSGCLYQVGVELVEARPRDAIVFLRVSRALPGLARDQRVPLCSCYLNIAREERDPSAIREGIRIARDILAGETEPPQQVRDTIREMLALLESLRAERGQ